MWLLQSQAVDVTTVTSRRNEYEKLEKYHGVRMWTVMAKVVTVSVVGGLETVTPKLKEWLQQDPWNISPVHLPVHRSKVMGTAEIPSNPKTPRLLTPDIEDDT